MSPHDPRLSHPAVRGFRARSEALAALCALAAACSPSGQPFASPQADDPEAAGGMAESTPSAVPPNRGGPGFVGSVNPLTNQDASSSLGLDGGVPSLTLGLSDDAGVSFTCASEFATCVLLDVSASGRCLDAYADCEPGFRGDAGADSGLNGECAVHFSACVLNDPLDFESCFPELTDCK